MSNIKQIDFSCKHNILLEDEEGLRVPMDEPYYRVEEIAPKTWKILSDGDYSYLLEGEEGDALLVDSGYGAGNIREYCEKLIGHPVPRIVNTHHHFDHTANNAYFDLAYMAEESVPLATVAFPSFEGIDFPRNYTVQIVEDGETIPLKGRDLLVFKAPDHAVGSIILLDRAHRILICGDEIGMPFGKPINTTVENWARLMEKLTPYRGEYDMVVGGSGIVEPVDIVQGYLDNCNAVLNGAEGVRQSNPPFNNWQQTDEQGRVVWKRRLPHPGDGPKQWRDDSEWKRKYGQGRTAIIYDVRRIHDHQITE
ncbi:MAG: MBL fold metallo-hydrolase [Clostridia bacterium]|nr:MBL fold metallo-hydrolase [Clostridia bacterium]